MLVTIEGVFIKPDPQAALFSAFSSFRIAKSEASFWDFILEY